MGSEQGPSRDAAGRATKLGALLVDAFFVKIVWACSSNLPAVPLDLVGEDTLYRWEREIFRSALTKIDATDVDALTRVVLEVVLLSVTAVLVQWGARHHPASSCAGRERHSSSRPTHQ
jgi:hypothetical protein